jgi:two-component system, response regulator
MSNVILLVEDNENDEILTKRALKKAGIEQEIVVARDGEEAVNYLFCKEQYKDRDPIRPELVILDINLPRLSGLSVLKELRSHSELEHLPVVMLTSSKEQQDIEQAYKLNANAYVLKPVDFTEFTETCEVLGKFWLLKNQSFYNANRF